MGTGSKIISVILRFGELCSSVIVVALLGRFFYLLHLAPDWSTDGRLVYTQVISCLELLSSIILIVPLAYSFYAWPLDAIFFISSIVAFGLMADVGVGRRTRDSELSRVHSLTVPAHHTGIGTTGAITGADSGPLHPAPP